MNSSTSLSELRSFGPSRAVAWGTFIGVATFGYLPDFDTDLPGHYPEVQRIASSSTGMGSGFGAPGYRL